MEQPLVTIGIPVYNVGRFIGMTLKSVLKQTYTNFELIITDDGSTDNTVEVIRSFNDPRITLIVDGENHGISYRLNQQIDLAKGKYFVRMDGDDLMFPERVEKQVHYLDEHPNVDVVGSPIVVIDDDNKIIGYRRYSCENLSKKKLCKATCFAHPTVCGRIEFFREFRYIEKYNGTEDNNLWIRGYKNNNFAQMERPFMFYRDPLVFKLKTYLSRMRVKKTMYRDLMQTNEADRSYLRKLIFMRNVRICLSYTLSKLHLDFLLIKRRNNIVEDCNAYTEVLDAIINKD